MEKHTTHSNGTSTKTRAAHLLMAAFAAFMLLLSIAPGADAQTRDTTTKDDGGTAVLAATEGCPDGFVEGRFGCVPENLTSEREPDFVVVEFDDGCPDGWVASTAPGGCSPENLTLEVVGYKVAIDAPCPDGWVISQAPGGCSPGFITLDTSGDLYEAQFHCAFGALCNDMVEAVKALGGECESSLYGETCTLPTGPEGRD